MEITKVTDLTLLNEYLEKLIESEALELLRCPSRSQTDLYIPYMMNDAAEYYMVLRDCAATGDTGGDFEADTEWEIKPIPGDDKHALILKRGDGTFVTLVFSDVSISKDLFQYHRIGHFWVKGDELWRRLVYIIGTISDKMTYLGEASCNDLEKELIPLIHFAPFRYYSPIKESIHDYYEEKPEGLQAFLNLARQVGDDSLCRSLTEYDRKMRRLNSRPWTFLTGESTTKKQTLQQEMAKELVKREHFAVYERLLSCIEEASLPYNVREYGADKREIMDEMRRSADRKMKEMGYKGTYPHYVGKEGKVTAFEEHPFTIQELDYKDFCFRIHIFTEAGVRKEL